MTNYTEKDLMAEYGDTELEALKEQFASLSKKYRALQKELERYKDESKLDKVCSELLRCKKIIRAEDTALQRYNKDLTKQNAQLRKNVRILKKHLETYGCTVYPAYYPETGETLYSVKKAKPKSELNEEEIVFLRRLISKLKEEQ